MRRRWECTSLIHLRGINTQRMLALPLSLQPVQIKGRLVAAWILGKLVAQKRAPKAVASQHMFMSKYANMVPLQSTLSEFL